MVRIAEWVVLGVTVFFVFALTVGLRRDARTGWIQHAAINARVCVILLIAVGLLTWLGWSYLHLIWVGPLALGFAQARIIRGMSIPLVSLVIDWLVTVYVNLAWLGIRIPAWSYLYAQFHFFMISMQGFHGALEKKGPVSAAKGAIRAVVIRISGITPADALTLVDEWYEEYPAVFLSDDFNYVLFECGVRPESVADVKSRVYAIATAGEGNPWHARTYGVAMIIEEKLGRDDSVQYWAAALRSTFLQIECRVAGRGAWLLKDH